MIMSAEQLSTSIRMIAVQRDMDEDNQGGLS